MKTILLTDKEQTEMKRILDGMNELVYTKIGAYIGMGDSWVRKYFITNNIFISRR